MKALMALGVIYGGCVSMPSRGQRPAAAQGTHVTADHRIFIIGQDLSALRGYFDSDCCLKPDGATAYLGLYDLSTPPVFGGLGYDLEGQELQDDTGWGGGPVGALQTARDFGVPHVAIGLSIAASESDGLQRVLSGAADPQIDRLADFADRVDGQVFLRIGYEFDGPWNPAYADPETFKQAWRHIVDRLRAAGADNIAFVWQACASPIDNLLDGGDSDISAWWPGDDYVDWVGMSWFLPADEHRPAKGYQPRTQRALADDVVAWARAKSKPVMIAESSPQGFDLKVGSRANIGPVWDGPPAQNVRRLTADEIWATWYVPYFDYIDANADVIRAVAYINVNWDRQVLWGPPYDQGFWGDSRLEVNKTVADRFNQRMDAWRRSP